MFILSLLSDWLLACCLVIQNGYTIISIGNRDPVVGGKKNKHVNIFFCTSQFSTKFRQISTNIRPLVIFDQNDVVDETSYRPNV